ncbi:MULTISPECIES: hypothetical protein [Streptomyces]|nr:hypothetical protein [Streptomyces sp. NEAU-383]
MAAAIREHGHLTRFLQELRPHLTPDQPATEAVGRLLTLLG